MCGNPCLEGDTLVSSILKIQVCQYMSVCQSDQSVLKRNVFTVFQEIHIDHKLKDRRKWVLDVMDVVNLAQQMACGQDT